MEEREEERSRPSMAGFEKGTAVASASESEVRKERAKTLDKESVIVRDDRDN